VTMQQMEHALRCDVTATKPGLWTLTGTVLPKRVLFTASLLHFSNDACFALFYPLLPLLASDLHLSYTQVGLLKTIFTGASSVLQIPAGLIGERLGEFIVLISGNLWVGIGLGAIALSPGYVILLVLVLLGGVGGNPQHPLAASLVSRVYERSRIATALGTLNVAGDLGKLFGVLVVGLIALHFGWRMVFISIGVFTTVLSLLLLWRHPGELPPPASTAREHVETSKGERARAKKVGWVLFGGSLDEMTRTVSLTFLPFLFARVGLDTSAISFLVGMIVVGGGIGRFVCGWLGDHWGIYTTILITEAMTAIALVGFLFAPLLLFIPLAIIFGFPLNGTSSVLQSAIAHTVPAHQRGRWYGLYFTVVLVSGALAPTAYGALGDRVGLSMVFVVVAALTALIPCVVFPMRRSLLAISTKIP
jgi:MFS transporter, FSR family, fosmidomycin resistance protein